MTIKNEYIDKKIRAEQEAELAKVKAALHNTTAKLEKMTHEHSNENLKNL
jgi:hypothetical protein